MPCHRPSPPPGLSPRSSFAALFTALSCALFTGACNPTLDWREHRFEDGGFTILLPQKPGRAERKLATPAGEVMMKMVSVRVEETVFGAASADFAKPPDAAALAALQAALLKNLEGTVQSDKPVISSAPAALAGREVIKRGTLGANRGTGERAADAHLRARFFVRGTRYYQIAVMGRAGAVPDADLDLFFASFRPD